MRPLFVLLCLLFSTPTLALSCGQYLDRLAEEEKMTEEEQMDLVWDDQYEGAMDLWLRAYGQLDDDANITALDIMHKRLKLLSRKLNKSYSPTLSRLRLQSLTQQACSQAPEASLVVKVAQQLPQELARLHEQAERLQGQIEIEQLEPLIKP